LSTNKKATNVDALVAAGSLRVRKGYPPASPDGGIIRMRVVVSASRHDDEPRSIGAVLRSI